MFSLPRTLPKLTQNLFKQNKNSATRPPEILNFQSQGASEWQHEPKRLPKGFLLRGPGAAQKHHFCCPKLSWGQDGPQESPSLDFGSSSNQFWTIFTCFRNLFLSICFIQDISRDLFREDLGQIILLWEYILAPICRKTRSVLRSRFSTALWVLFKTVFGAPGPPRRNPFGSLFGSRCHPEAPRG